MGKCISIPGFDAVCFGNVAQQINGLDFGLTSAGLTIMILIAAFVAAFIFVNPA